MNPPPNQEKSGMQGISKQRRRRFLKNTLIASAVLGFSFVSVVQAGQSAAAVSSGSTAAASTRMLVSVTGSLYEVPQSIDLPLGVWSDVIKLKGKGDIRVKVIPSAAHVDPKFGPVFTVIMGDASGKELGRINLGNRAIGTFTDYGIQFFIAEKMG
jgi:hypothetical protein